MYCPYKYSVNLEEGFYYFYTVQGDEYRCFFTESRTRNILSLDVKSRIFSFDLVRYSGINSPKFDRNVSATIGAILNLFFDKNPEIILNYICDDSDSKARKRQFSFGKWLKSFNRDPKKVLIQGSVLDTIYVGAVLLESHPEKNEILAFFESELESLENEMSKTGEVRLIES